MKLLLAWVKMVQATYAMNRAALAWYNIWQFPKGPIRLAR